MAIGPTLLGPWCSECRLPKTQCEKPQSITGSGRMSRWDDPTAVVRWPRCARSYAALRHCGQDLLSLPEIVEWAHARDRHKDPDLSAGGARLIREWLRCKDLGKDLAAAKREADRKAAQR